MDNIKILLVCVKPESWDKEYISLAECSTIKAHIKEDGTLKVNLDDVRIKGD